MKQGWEENMLKEIGITQTGTTPKTTDKDNYGDFIPFIKPADIDTFNDGEIRYDNDGLSEKGLQAGRKMSEGSILMVCIGATIGKVGFVDRDVSCNQQVNSLTVKNGYYPKFFYYALTTSSFYEQVMKNASQATLPIINKGKWECLTVKYPKSINEQQRIVAILDETFAAIAKAKANAEQNLKNAKELFDSYLQSVFENKGEGWEEKTLGEICKVERGSSPRPIERYFTDDADGVNWIKIGDTKEVEKYIYKTRQKITKEGALQSRFVDIDDFILSNSMSFGKPYIMKTEGYIHDGWFVLRLPKTIDTEFFWYLLSSPYTMNQFISLAAGAIVKNISGDLVKKTVLPIPPLNEQQIIVQKLDALSAQTKKLEAIYQQHLNDLEELKKSILQKAFNGELKTTTSLAA